MIHLFSLSFILLAQTEAYYNDSAMDKERVQVCGWFYIM